MIDFIQTLPPWLIKAGALVLGLIVAVGLGLLMAWWLRKLAAKLPDRE